MSVAELRELTRAKRLAAFDYGSKRVGWAVCDEMHITTSTRGVLYRDDKDFWDKLCQGLRNDRIALCLVGIPFRNDNSNNSFIEKIRAFIEELQRRSGLQVIEVDESFSSKRAVQTMIEIGVPKAQRRQKERTDEIAAAIMLRDFLTEIE